MGGGGGDWSAASRSAGSSMRIDRAVATATADASYEASANTYMRDLLSSYNDRDAAEIQARIETIRNAIEKDIDGEVDMLFGGSVRKHTYVDGISDVDVLLTLNASELASASPAEVLRYVEQRLTLRLGKLGVAVNAGALAVTVRYPDGMEIQVLPALRTATGVRIASPDGRWSQVVRPQQFARKLTAVNQANNGRVVPVIKLFKGLQSQTPTNSQLRGYHVESLAIEAFRAYTGRQTLKDMLRHFVECAARRVSSPIADSTGQSLHVDDYLGLSGSADRKRVSAALDRIGQSLDSADARSSIEALRRIFGDD
jgi:hypothetical protein